MNFWQKKRLSSDEYLELRALIDKVKINLEALQLEHDLVIQKIRSRLNPRGKGNTDDTTQDLYNGVLIKE